MGIELSVASSAGFQETTAPSRMQSPKDPAVPEWTSILGFLFQIEQPPEGDPAASVNSETQVPDNSAAAPDAAFWAGFMVHRPAAPLKKADETVELGETEPVATISPSDYEPLKNEPLEAGEGFELLEGDWLILPAPIPVEHRHSTPLLGNSSPASPDQREPSSPAHSQQPQNAEHPRPAGVSSEPATVEAVFRLQPTFPASPSFSPPGLGIRGLASAATRSGSLADLPLELKEKRADGVSLPEPSWNNSLISAQEAGSSDSSTSGNSGEPQAGNQESTPPREPPIQAERGTWSATNHSNPIGKWSNDKLVAESAEPVHESIRNSTNTLTPDKRASPLQLQLRISPDDFGTRSTGGGNEIRLNLIQRGDDVLMKIQGGGEPLALNAKSEWEALVDRLKPHGLEPSSKAFYTETSRREGESWIPSVPEQTKSDSAADSGQQHQRPGQEQQQQRQQKQRHSTKSGANTTPFSFDYDPADPQAIQGATS